MINETTKELELLMIDLIKKSNIEKWNEVKFLIRFNQHSSKGLSYSGEVYDIENNKTPLTGLFYENFNNVFNNISTIIYKIKDTIESDNCTLWNCIEIKITNNFETTTSFIFDKDHFDKYEQIELEQQEYLNNLKKYSQTDLLENFGVDSFQKQLIFNDLIGADSWSIDIDKEEIKFGTNSTFKIQVLGTISYSTQTWLWAWANTKSDLPKSIIEYASLLKQYGKDNSVNLFVDETFDYSNEDLHNIGLIASGLTDAKAYYIADYGKGAMLILIKNEIETDDNIDNFSVFFMKFISIFEVNHKNAFLSYFTLKNFNVQTNNNEIIAKRENTTIKGIFDSDGRIQRIAIE